jgi:hypothetical protein
MRADVADFAQIDPIRRNWHALAQSTRRQSILHLSPKSGKGGTPMTAIADLHRSGAS